MQAAHPGRGRAKGNSKTAAHESCNEPLQWSSRLQNLQPSEWEQVARLHNTINFKSKIQQQYLQHTTFHQKEHQLIHPNKVKSVTIPPHQSMQHQRTVLPQTKSFCCQPFPAT
ncbi:hypothetical protein Nepgr_005339 [Nepenthes gracilis]|uniref:Uncharacterized protein n=1 Tax=Nepenthes gracilis TaxID=150966 RepID=A0AAD3S383_NEPGR|nr:hypothetical protein Nepgr_005339 [Nepenthes gracilis]